MAGQFETKQRTGRKSRFVLPIVLIALGMVLMLVTGGFLMMERLLPRETTPPQLQEQTVPSTTPNYEPQQSTPPTQPPVTKVSTATIGSTGDLLLHNKVIRSGYDKGTGTYNYDSIFSYFSEFVSQVDYAVANLEVTLCGEDNGYEYSGYPCFNAPDAIVDAANNDILANAMEEAESILANGGFSNVTMDEVCLVNDASGNHIGYVASVTLKAYDVMTLTFGYTTDGVVTGLAFLSIKETPGIGMKADEPAFKEQFAGNKADSLVSVKSGAGDGEINAISGATFTTEGVLKGVNAGICFMKELQTRLGGAN